MMGLGIKWQQDRHILCLRVDYIKDHEGHVTESKGLRNVAKNPLSLQ